MSSGHVKRNGSLITTMWGIIVCHNKIHFASFITQQPTNFWENRTVSWRPAGRPGGFLRQPLWTSSNSSRAMMMMLIKLCSLFLKRKKKSIDCNFASDIPRLFFLPRSGRHAAKASLNTPFSKNTLYKRTGWIENPFFTTITTARREKSWDEKKDTYSSHVGCGGQKSINKH